MISADELIRTLDLKPLPTEGGYYAETYRAAETIAAEALDERYGGDGSTGAARSTGTAIYYMITADSFSAMHRVKSDEIFHFYLGDPVRMLQLHPDGSGSSQTIGPDVARGMAPQVVVPHGVWQGAAVAPGGSFALLGCTVSPGFEFEDFEEGERDALIERYPEFRREIEALTRAE